MPLVSPILTVSSLTGPALKSTLCFRSNVVDHNFSTRIPIEAHQRHATHNDLTRLFVNPGESHIISLFGPPGIGKTDSGIIIIVIIILQS